MVFTETSTTMIKTIIAIIGVVVSTWGALWLTFLAMTSEAPAAKFGLCMGAALLFCAAIACAGYGQSKKEHKDECKDTDKRADRADG